MKKLVNRLIVAVVALTFSHLSLPASAQQDAPYYNPQQIEQDVAPIALYPDQLLGQILMAATYPLEVADADRWVRDPRNARLTGDRLAAALESQDWDPSVKALVPFPQILAQMTSRPDWTDRLGEEFIGQEADVTDAVQRLRAQAYAAGNLRSSPQQIVRYDGPSIIIAPAQPDVVYVPYYDPRVAYGSWEYADYPPQYFPPPRGYALGTPGIFFLGAIPVVSSLWGWNDWDWGQRRIVIRRDRYLALNLNRPPRFSGDNWQHDVYHRRGADYRAPAIRQQAERGTFGQRDVTRDRRYENAARQFDARSRQAEQQQQRVRERERIQNVNRPPNNDARDRQQPNQQPNREQQRVQQREQQQQQRAQQQEQQKEQAQQRREQQQGQQRAQQREEQQKQQALQREQQQQQRAQQQGQQREQQQQRAQQQEQQRAQQQGQQREQQQQRAQQRPQQPQQQQRQQAQQPERAAPAPQLGQQPAPNNRERPNNARPNRDQKPDDEKK